MAQAESQVVNFWNQLHRVEVIIVEEGSSHTHTYDRPKSLQKAKVTPEGQSHSKRPKSLQKAKVTPQGPKPSPRMDPVSITSAATMILVFPMIPRNPGERCDGSLVRASFSGRRSPCMMTPVSTRHPQFGRIPACSVRGRNPRTTDRVFFPPPPVALVPVPYTGERSTTNMKRRHAVTSRRALDDQHEAQACSYVKVVSSETTDRVFSHPLPLHWFLCRTQASARRPTTNWEATYRKITSRQHDSQTPSDRSCFYNKDTVDVTCSLIFRFNDLQARLYSLMFKYADANCALVASCHRGRQRLGKRSPGGVKHRVVHWLSECGIGAGMKVRGRGEIPNKTHRPTASSGTIPSCKNPGVTRPRTEPGSHLWEASRLTAHSATVAPNLAWLQWFVADYLPSRRTGFDSQRSDPGFRTRKTWRNLPLAGGFLGVLPFPSPLQSDALPSSSHFTFTGTQNLAVKRRSGLLYIFVSIASPNMRARYTQNCLEGSALNLATGFPPIKRQGHGLKPIGTRSTAEALHASSEPLRVEAMAHSIRVKARWVGSGANCVSGRTPYAYKGRKSCKETCIAAERDWAAMASDWGHEYLPRYAYS
ncbi:hypothetical protein PR048_016817 [Dryococelus australis]|uniref:Uncharacterized protein n=1 Tax=Dryococelus australis TaxID=614101 RepID=A0ABQ9H7R9_9NEOP|nr:hypothetical protein PR048_016817 [Dryococelus australis]